MSEDRDRYAKNMGATPSKSSRNNDNTNEISR